jgi:capsular exopolysaccharide synthesis family protein
MGELISSDRIDNTLQEFFYVTFRHKKRVVAIFLGIMLMAGLVTMLMPRIYRSEAKLLVRLGHENASMDPTATGSGPVVQVQQQRETEIKSELEILRSRDLAESVVDQIGPEALLPKSFFSIFGKSSKSKERGAAVEKVMNNWGISSDKDSNIIRVAYTANSPKLAHDVVATLVKAYLAKHLLVNRTRGSYDFFKEQTSKTAAELKNIEIRLADAKNHAELTSLEDQRRIIQDRAGAFQRDLEQSSADYQVSQAKIAATKELLAHLPEKIVTSNTSGFPNVAADGMRQKLYELQLKEQELLSKYTEKNFLVQETRREIRNAEALLKREPTIRGQVTKGINAAYEQTKLALVAEQANNAGLQTRIKALAASLANAKNGLQSFNGSEVQIAQLQREKEILDASYREYSKKMEQARIDSALETEKISNISIAQAATYPIRRSSPRTGLNLALAFLVGSFGAVGMAYWLESMDPSLKRMEDVERRLHLPLLTTIPLLDGKHGFASQAKESLPGSDRRMGCNLLGEAGECYEILINRLLSEDVDAEGRPPKIIGLIGCYSGTGVSTVATNLAECLSSRSNERVMFVEANLVTPSAHTYFGIQHSPGLTDFIAEGSDFSASIKNSVGSKLEIIPSGQGKVTVSQLADSKAFSEMLKVLKTEYSYAVIDLPPIFKSISGLRLAAQTDGVILVVGAEGDSWQTVQEATKLLAQAKVKVIGVVLNKQQHHVPEWLSRIL